MVEQWWVTISRGKSKKLGQKPALGSLHQPVISWKSLGLNPRFRNEKPASNALAVSQLFICLYRARWHSGNAKDSYSRCIQFEYPTSYQLSFLQTLQASPLLSFSLVIIMLSQWPRGLSYEPSSPARTLGSWVRIPL
jgi:hypothetical protein